MRRTKVVKVMGWKDCEVECGDIIYDDIMQGTTSLSREEGQITEHPLESGESEGTHKDPDKYILEIKRTIGPDEDVTPGFKDNVGNVEVRPRRAGARTVLLENVSQDISVEYGSGDGAVEVVRWKTKGAVDEEGNLTDISIGRVGGYTYTEVSETAGKNPKSEGWYIKNGTKYIPALDTSVVQGQTYYSRSNGN